MELVYECTCVAQLSAPVMVGKGPYGVRMGLEVLGGSITGDRINGTVEAGSDWALMGADGYIRMDVRAQLSIVDGAVIFAQFPGLIQMNHAVGKALAEGASTSFGDQYFRTTPRLETGSERYDWVNREVFIGEGRFTEGLGLEYRIYVLT